MAENVIGEAFIAIRASLEEFKKDTANIQKEVSNTLKPVQDKMKSVGASMADVGKNMTKGITVPIVAAGTALVGIGQTFDDATDKIRIGTGATGEQLSKLEQSFKNVYSSVPASVDDVSTAIADLNTRLGLSGKPLEDMATQVLNLARITGEDLSTTIQNSTRLFGDWGITVENQSAALDTVFKASQQTGIGVDQLMGLLVQFGGPLRQMGFSMEEAAAMMGKFEKEGVNTELVLGSLRIALGKMAKEGIQDPAEALSVMIQRIKDAGSAGEANALALEMFGARAGPDMAAAIREGRLDLDSLLATMESSPETINGAANATDGFAEKMTLLKNNLAATLEPLGTTLLNALENLTPVIENVVNVISRLVEWFSNLDPSIQTIILGAIGLLAALGPIIGVVSTLGTTFSFLVSPIGLVVAAIAAAIAIGVLLYQNWDEISAYLTNIWNSIKDTATNVWNGIKDFFTNLWNGIKDTATNIWEGVKNAVMTPINSAKDLLSNVWNTISTNLSNVWNGIKNIASSQWEKIKTIIMNPIDSLRNLLSGAWDGIKNTASNAWNGLIDTAKNIFNKVKDAILHPFQNLKIPLPHFKFGTRQVSVAGLKFPVPDVDVEWYKTGGIFTSPSIIGVGEAGTEVVTPLDALTDNIQAAVYQGIMDAISIRSVVSQPEDRDLILNIDGKTLARLLLPEIINESQRQGLNLAFKTGGV